MNCKNNPDGLVRFGTYTVRHRGVRIRVLLWGATKTPAFPVRTLKAIPSFCSRIAEAILPCLPQGYPRVA